MTRKIILIIFLITLLFPLRLSAVTQGSDEVTLLKPTNGQNVSGSYSVEWKMTDPDVNDPAYFIDIFNLSCEQSGGNIGRLINSGASKNGDTYSYSWDTASGNLSGSLQNQGNYCMRVCGILAEGGSVYSLCDKQSFVFSSGGQSATNTPPVIESSKEGFSVTLNQVFSYKVVASDPEGDNITFSLVNAPDFLTINSTTGEVSGKPTEVGDIKFIVKADDGKGGITTQEFVMKVQVAGARKEVEFSFPVSGSSVTSDNNEIKWDVDSSIQVRTIVLSFSKDKNSWQEITRLDRDTGSYKWNVNEIDPGEYYLRIQLTDTSNKLFEIVSQSFNVSASTVVDRTEITGLSPSEGSTLNNNRPVISASFNTPEGVVIDPEDVKFTLNERIDLAVCEILSTGISCNVLSELSDGQYKVYIELVDSDGATIVKEWSFNVNMSGGSSGGDIMSGNTLQLIIIIFAVGFVLIALPWSLYIFLKRRKNNKDQTEKISDQPQQVIHPVGGPEGQTPMIGTQPLAGSENTAPVVGTQSLIDTQSVGVSDNIPAATPMSQVAAPMSPSVEPVSQLEVSSAVMPVNNVSGFEGNPVAVGPEPIVTEAAQTPALEVPSMDSPQPPVLSDNISAIPAPVAPPEMYNQEEIPQWLQETNSEDVKAASTEGGVAESAMEDIVNKADVLEGSKVYDPYGLALNSDESQSQKHN